MRIQGILGKLPWLYGIAKGNRSQPKEGESHPLDVITKVGQGGTVAHREDHDPQ